MPAALSLDYSFDTPLIFRKTDVAEVIFVRNYELVLRP
jgi:hypothetical protein